MPSKNTDTTQITVTEQDKSFPVVGIGASAGGFEACTQMLAHLPVKTGMAYVLIQHLDPHHESHLVELLSRHTKIPIEEAKDGMKLQPDRIYVIPPNTDMIINHGRLQLSARTEKHGQHMSIDYFFRSLSEDQGNRAIAIILSGTGSDGALGVKEIKSAGGITFCQDEQSAKYDGMPRSAIITGYVDFVLSPDKIAAELSRISEHPYVYPFPPVRLEESTKLPDLSESSLAKIFLFLRITSGIDFTHYRRNTILRRIMRRMALRKIESLEEYSEYLKGHAPEVEDLYHDMLIGVTSFFRDRSMFDTLRNKIFPILIKNRSHDEAIRIWVPGCASGEEVYSHAIYLLEFLEKQKMMLPIQLFGTDVNNIAIDKARTGIYIENIAIDVSPERLNRYFTKIDHRYQVNKSIRDMCIFAKHDIIQDPPFSKLDIISCRNMLIYMEPVLQKKVIPTLHYALKDLGFLVLGGAETIGEFSQMFKSVDKEQRIYSKIAVSNSSAHYIQTKTFHEPEMQNLEKQFIRLSEFVPKEVEVQKLADRIVLSRYAPTSVVVNENLEIIQFRGDTSPFLRPSSGKASLNLLKMAREGLVIDLHSAIGKAKKSGYAKKEDIQVKFNGEFREITLEVIPLGSRTHGDHYLILFQEIQPKTVEKGLKTDNEKPVVLDKKEHHQIAQLEQQLASTREYLQAIIETHENTNQELQTANEEILSNNEELQSINEELETAKEELQSSNEELTTVNEELHNRNYELNNLNNDLNNLLTAVNVPTVILGLKQEIRRFTPGADKIMNLIPSDIGRPIGNIKPTINIPHLEQSISDVIKTSAMTKLDVKDNDGRWFTMRIFPYLTAEEKVNGVVITFYDITELKLADEKLQTRSLLRTVGAEFGQKALSSFDLSALMNEATSLVAKVLNLKHSYILERQPNSEEFKVIAGVGWNQEIIGHKVIYGTEDFGIGYAFRSQSPVYFHDLASETRFKTSSLLTAYKIVSGIKARIYGEPMPFGILGVFSQEERTFTDDEIAFVQLIADILGLTIQRNRLENKKDEFISIASHEIKTPLTGIKGFTQLLKQSLDKEDELSFYLSKLDTQVDKLSNLVNGLLDVSKIQAIKLELKKEKIKIDDVVKEIVEDMQHTTRQHRIVIDGKSQQTVWADKNRIAQVLNNLLSNAVLYSPKTDKVIVHLSHDKDNVIVEVEDFGIGIADENQQAIFERFFQAKNLKKQNQSGLGLGLYIAKEIITLHNGKIWVESQKNNGSSFFFTLPITKEI